MKTKKQYNFDIQAIQEAIGERIKAIREQHGMLQKDLAEKLNVNRSTVSGIEKGRISLTLAHLITICDTFDASLDYIVKGKGTDKVGIPDFEELTGKIIEMLKDMEQNPATLHSVLSSYYEKKLVTLPGTGQKKSLK